MNDSGTPRVAMVLATNRVSPYLAEALDSMRRQSYPLQIVLVDDGCPDPGGLRAVLEGFPGILLHRQEPAGVSVARNAGVSLTDADLIGFFDDDDRYPADWVERHVKNLQTHPRAVLSYGGLRLIDADGCEFGMQPPSPIADPRDVRRRDVQILAGSYLMWRADFQAVGGFNPLFRRAQDLDFNLRCLERGDFAYAPGLVRDYRTHDENATADHRQTAEAIRRILTLHLRTAAAGGRPDAVRDFRLSLAKNRRYAIWRAQQAAGKALAAGRPSAAISEVGWMLGFAPGAPAILLAKAVHHAVTCGKSAQS